MSWNTIIEKTMEEKGFVVHSVREISIQPLLNQEKDAVRLVLIQNELKRGDIVLFRRLDGKLVLHRIIQIRKDGYRIRGDNYIRSELVQRDQIIAIAEG